MRLISYFHPAQDPFVLRDRLKAAGWQQVAMRDGSLWRADSRAEAGWDAVHAPLYPGIVRAYEQIGTPIEAGGASGFKLPPPPVEVEALPSADCYAVINPGAFLLEELAALPLPAGCRSIGVNEAPRRVACDWHLCNDGFTDAKFQGAIGEPGRITRERFAATIPTGAWFNLGRLGIVEGTFSTTCALRCAASAAPVVYLYGHDLQPGNGMQDMTGHWDASQISNAAAEVAAEIARMRAAGVRVVHVRWVDGKAVEEDGTQAVVTLPLPKPRKGRRNA